MNNKVTLPIALTFTLFLHVPIPYTVYAKSRAVLDLDKQGVVQYNAAILDACTPFSYHSHDNVTDVTHSTINASRTMNQTIGCAVELTLMKSFCQVATLECSDPRFTNFLVHDYGTPTFEQAFAIQNATMKAQHQNIVNVLQVKSGQT
jgi:hypothetical protein